MYGSPPPAAAQPPEDLNRPFQMSSGLLRYRSAPSSLLGGEACEDFLPAVPRPSSPETETLFARFLSPDLRHHDIRPDSKSLPPPSSPAPAGGGHRKSQLPPPAPVSAAAAAEEFSSAAAAAAMASQMMYNHHQHQMMAMDADQIKDGGGGGHCPNLIRQSSSPAGLFAHLNVESGYGVMRGMGGFRNGNEGGLGVGSNNSNSNSNRNRLKSQLSFSSRQSSLMSQISEMENESIGGYPMNSWEESPILSDNNFSSSCLKRPRENQTEQTQNGEVRNGLRHQFGLPKASSEIVGIEKFLQFQDSVPCKIRAKRGCATHPRSIAERVRRTRISERMRKLQELVPNMDKQTNTADMLDLAVDYIKDLQKQVKTLSDSRAKCTCSSSKQKPYTNPTV